MRRRLFTTASALSLLLCIAIAALWARSYWAWESIEYYGTHGAIEVGATKGTLVYMRNPTMPPRIPRWQRDTESASNLWASVGRWPRTCGFSFAGYYDSPVNALWVSCWIPSVLTTIPPCLWLWRRRAHHGPGFPVTVKGKGLAAHPG
jgi:hypothetical protein